MPDIGFAVGGRLDVIEDLARGAEDMGYESVWVAETTTSAFVQATLACRATSRVKVGTNIALAFPRSPTITAMAARDLAELSGNRFILGLGSQIKRINEHRFSVRFENPAPKMAEYVEVVREVLANFRGEPIDHRGRFYTVTMSGFPGIIPVGDVPIYMAAVNERMCEAAGRVADGVFGHPMTSPKYIAEVVRPAVERGAARAGRAISSVSFTNSVIIQVDEDRDRARREAALQVGFYATTRAYAPVLTLHGFEDRGAPLRRAYASGDLGALVELAMPMVDTFAIIGSEEECRERLSAFDGLVDRIVLGGSWLGREERLVENHHRLLRTFRPAG